VQRVDPVLTVLFIHRPGAPFGNAMHQRFRVLELASLALAEPDPPCAAVAMGYPLASKVASNLLFFIPVSELIS
jgi:hypothetical protein